MYINIDLCESLYDTRTWVYDFEAGFGFGNPYACTADAGCGYSGYQSRISRMPAVAGHTYYIIVDGYGGDCGEYVLLVEEYIPCFMECPAGVQLEGEPPLLDGYWDTHNGGCNSPPDYPFQYLLAHDGEFAMCGNAGNYDYQDQVPLHSVPPFASPPVRPGVPPAPPLRPLSQLSSPQPFSPVLA